MGWVRRVENLLFITVSSVPFDLLQCYDSEALFSGKRRIPGILKETIPAGIKISCLPFKQFPLLLKFPLCLLTALSLSFIPYKR